MNRLLDGCKRNVAKFLIFPLAAFVFLINSPLHPWVGGLTETDSSVFKTVAFMMESGFMPYRDTFDHKGPLLYVINWLGNKISFYKGVWIIEFFVLTFSLYLMYKIANLVCGQILSLFIALISLTTLFGLFCGGNLVEEYAMLPISFLMFAFIDYLRNQRLSYFVVGMAGCCVASIMLLRPNMVAAFIPFCLVTVVLIAQKNGLVKLLQYIGVFVIGMMLISAPIFFWLGINGCLDEMWFAYVEFNMQYTNPGGSTIWGGAEWSTLIYFLSLPAFTIAIVLILYYCYKDNKYRILNITYCISMIMALLAIGIAGRAYDHYGMVLIPMISYPFGLLFDDLTHFENKDLSEFCTFISAMILAFYLVVPTWLNYSYSIVGAYYGRNGENRDENVLDMVGQIVKYTDDDDIISVYGNYDVIYLLANRKHATKYSYQFPISSIMPSIREEYFMQLQNEMPKIIVIQQGKYDNSIESFINENGYTIVWPDSGANNEENLVFYKTP